MLEAFAKVSKLSPATDTSVGAWRTPYLSVSAAFSSASNHGIGYARFVERRFRKLAVRAGLGGEQKQLARLIFRSCRLGFRAFRRDAVTAQMRVRNVIQLAVLEFFRLAVVPVLHGR